MKSSETPLVGQVLIAAEGQRSPRFGWPRTKTRVCPMPYTCQQIGLPVQHRSPNNWASALSTSPKTPRSSSRQRVTPLTATPTFTRHRFRFSTHHRKVILGVILIAMGTALWVTVTQLAKTTYQYESSFFAPFFVVYFSTAWLVVVYPMYIIGHVICVRGRVSLKETFRENMKVYSEDGMTYRPLRVAVKVVCFPLLWVISSYVYIRALHMKPCLDVITLFATNSSFVYLLAWIILHKQFMPLRIVSILLAMTGICIVTYMDGGFSNQSMWSAVLAVTSTSGAASYKVLFKKVAGDATLGQVSLFLSCLSLFSIVTLWPLLLLLYFTKAEPIDWDRVPWGLLCGTAGTALLLNFTLHHGASVTYPVLLQVTFIIAIPLTAVVDLMWRHERFTGMQVAASVVILISALLNLVPPQCPECLTRLITFKPRPGTDSSTATPPSVTTTNSTAAITPASTTKTKTVSTSWLKKMPRRPSTSTSPGTTTTFIGPRQMIRSTAC